MKSIKKLLTISLSTAALSSISIAAQAWQPTFYAGGNLGSSQHKQNTYAHNFTVLSFEAVGGINLLPYLAVEARLGAGYNEDRIGGEHSYWYEDINGDAAQYTSPQTGDDFRENYYASFYLRPGWSNERAGIYALIGATSVELSSNNAFLEDSDTGVSYGIGTSFKVSENIDLTAEWKKQIATDNFDIRGGTAGFRYNF